MMSLDSDSPSVAWTSTFPNNQTDSLWYTSAKHFENLDLPDDLLSGNVQIYLINTVDDLSV